MWLAGGSLDDSRDTPGVSAIMAKGRSPPFMDSFPSDTRQRSLGPFSLGHQMKM